MASISTTPTYNLKVVVQETGVKPDTLRAWERRYGLPQPDRTSGGHRLYSQRDIETIKWLVTRQEEGLSISRAVKLWRTLQEEGKNPLQAMSYHTTEVKSSIQVTDGSTVVEMRQAWVEACLEFDEAAAEGALTQAFALYPPEMVCLEVIQKGLSEIGDLWYQNEATVQQEHFASALAMRRLNALVAAAPPSTRSGRILIGCPPEEEHTFAPLLLTLLLRYQGWEVPYLGANVPLARLESTIQAIEPQLVILTAQQLYTAATLLQAAQFLQEREATLAFGGSIFNRTPALREHIPGHFLGESLEEAVQVVAQLLTMAPPLPATKSAPEQYQETLIHYRVQRAIIERDVWQRLQEKNPTYNYISTANTHLAQDIEAALMLGELDALSGEIDWTKKLITNHQMPSETLHQYLDAYHKAVETHLGDVGRPVAEWLARVKDNHNPRSSEDK